MMNLLHWRLLVAVADAGNISRAAEEIGMTQSGASQAIAQLEASLGFPVFTRERRYIGITALGEQVVEHARNMLSQLNSSVNWLIGAGTSPAGAFGWPVFPP